MRLAISLAFACAIVGSQASLHFEALTLYRPRVSAIVSHLESRGLLSWEDHELGHGGKIAVYHLQDWHDAKQYLTNLKTRGGLPPNMDFNNGTLDIAIEPRAPVPVASASPGTDAATSYATGPITPDPPTQVSAAATSTPGSSGTSSVPMADATNHVTKWICNQPYNIPANLGQSALAAIVCQYIFPFFQKKATGPQDTVVQRTMQLPPQANPANPGRFAQVLIHVEKNNLWPALKTILCSTLITQVVNNAYCWAYGKKFQLGEQATPQRIPGSTAGGQIYIYDTTGTQAVGFFEMDVVGE